MTRDHTSRWAGLLVTGALLAGTAAASLAVGTTLRRARGAGSQHEIDEPEEAETASVRPVGLVGTATFVITWGGFAAATLRALYGIISHPGEDIRAHAVISTVWHSQRPLDGNAILTAAGTYLGVAAALFLATAFGSSSEDRVPLLIQDRLIATQRLASAVAIFGVITFWALIPDAVQSKQPVAMVVLCLAVVAISGVIGAINGPRATEHERRASAAEARLALIRHTVATLRNDGVRLPERSSRVGTRLLAGLRMPVAEADVFVRMLVAVRWRWIAVISGAILADGVALAMIADPAVGISVAAVGLATQFVAILYAISSAYTPRADARAGRWYPAPVGVIGGTTSVLIVMLAHVSVMTPATTTMTVFVMLIVSAVIQIVIVWLTFLIITRDRGWILGGLMILEQRVRGDLQRSLVLAEQARITREELAEASGRVEVRARANASGAPPT